MMRLWALEGALYTRFDVHRRKQSGSIENGKLLAEQLKQVMCQGEPRDSETWGGARVDAAGRLKPLRNTGASVALPTTP